jgi:channel protein (hemolysin III family)
VQLTSNIGGRCELGAIDMNIPTAAGVRLKSEPIAGDIEPLYRAGDCGAAVTKRTKPSGCCFCHLMNERPSGNKKYVSTTIEEVANVVTHFVPFVLSFWALHLMLTNVCDTFAETVVAYVFCLGLVTCFGFSTVYHLSSLFFAHWTPTFLKFDLSGIFLLISCAYTPWMVLKIPGTMTGTLVCTAIWGLGIFGIVKTFAHYLPSISQITIYMMMSGLSIFTFQPLMQSGLGAECMLFLMGGIGACGIGFLVFTQDGRIPFAHSVFHSFVAIGVGMHYYAVYTFVMGPVKA